MADAHQEIALLDLVPLAGHFGDDSIIEAVVDGVQHHFLDDGFIAGGNLTESGEEDAEVGVGDNVEVLLFRRTRWEAESVLERVDCISVKSTDKPNFKKPPWVRLLIRASGGRIGLAALMAKA